MIKEKKCKGTGRAKGFESCGEMVPVEKYGQANRVYGLGKSCGCYQKWLLKTTAGRQKLAEGLLQGVKKLKRQQKALENKQKKIHLAWKKEKTIELMSANQYRSKFLQPVINEIARLIDYGHPCIATENYGKENGGHYISVGSNVTISLNLHNIHIQSFESNHYKSGDTVNYQNGIRKIYGQEYLDFMDRLQSCPELKLGKQEMIELTKKAKDIRKRLRENKYLRSPMERIEARDEVNLELGIYPKIYSVF